MIIKNIKVIVTSPGRNFVTLKIETDQGIYGLGDATLNGRELSVVSYLEDHVIPVLIGRDAHRIQDIWASLYKGAYWRRGPVTMSAISAVDVALWDIKAKAANMPLYQLLGGASRDGVLVYGHANGANIAETVAAVGSYIDQGYKAVRAQSGIPGVKGSYGVGKGTDHYEPADSTLPEETVWSTTAYLNFIPELFETLRKTYGNEIELLHDVHHRLTPNEAGALGKALEPYRLFWMEDCTPAENQDAFRLVREKTVTPLAVGEVFNSIHDCRRLIENQWIDYIRATLVHAGGVTHLRQIASLAELYQVRTGFHGATDLSPVCMGTALNFDLWVPNFGIQEYMKHSAATDEVFPHSYTFKDGYMHPGETPGHGVDIDEELAAKYPYEPKQLPIARLTDGTLWNW
ncbi:MAG: bifunctional D-altronate/D-mannonate dehydratase [Robiginitomaculum sp.]|nr:MAG: bifunctional D-altronate/D-mannonate dehydratase [Robiginitomaculum sp.]